MNTVLQKRRVTCVWGTLSLTLLDLGDPAALSCVRQAAEWPVWQGMETCQQMCAGLEETSTHPRAEPSDGTAALADSLIAA